MLLSDHVYCVAIAFKMTECVEQWICIKFCVKLGPSSTETIHMIQKAAAVDTRRPWQHARSGITFPVEFFGETSNHPGDSALLQPRFGALRLLAFTKLKSPLKGKRFQTVSEIQENTMGQLMAIGRIVWGPKMPTLKGTEVSLSYVQGFLYLVSSVNVSVYHITRLRTFWTDLY